MRPAAAFLCDEMLGRLARYLRAAGYDTTLAAGGAPDREWIAIAGREGRLFLTVDRGVAEHKAGRDVAVILPRGTLDELAAALSSMVAVDWLRAPFSRCLVDNAALEPAPARQAEVPADVGDGPVRQCPACGRLYWAGSHHRRMSARLAAWRHAHPPPPILRGR